MCEGRKAVLLHEDGSPRGWTALAETMGIEICRCSDINVGIEDARGYLAE